MNAKRTPPPNWYVTANLPLALAWAFGLPIYLCLLADYSWISTIVLTFLWWIANGRIVDRYIPVLTGPIVEYAYRLSHPGNA
jgi:hypothetical protein